MNKRYFFKTTETETITREKIYCSYGETEQDAKDKMFDEMKNGYYYKEDFPRVVQPIKSVSHATGLKALELKCVAVEKESFMSDDELNMIKDVNIIYDGLRNMKNTHPDLNDKMEKEFDDSDVYDIDNIQIKYYKLAFGKDLFCCPINETLYFIEDGVM